MYGMHSTHFDDKCSDLLSLDHVCFDCLSHETCESTVLEQKRFDLRLLSLTLRNRWVLLVYIENITRW